MDESIFDKVEKKANIKKEDLLKLAKSVSGQDLNNEDNLRSLIKKIARLAGKEVSKEKEEKIKRLKEQNNVDRDALIKSFLSITYAFPSITIDYLCNQTMAQIQWLQKYAAGAVSYEVNAQAMAAGNMKKGKKLEFFIK